jgi:hypothetical protein
MFVLVHTDTKEYLRNGWDRDDAYTDDLGRALDFPTAELALKEKTDTEEIYEITFDEEGNHNLTPLH